MVDLPGVGENLMDHQGTAVFLVPRDELAPPDDRVCQLGARYSSSLGTAEDDMWLSMWSPWDLTEFPDMQSALGVRSISALVVGVHDPLSRGTVRLRTTDPDVRPQVDFRMLTDPGDLPRLVEGLQLVMSLAAHRAFAASYEGIGLLDTIERGRPRRARELHQVDGRRLVPRFRHLPHGHRSRRWGRGRRSSPGSRRGRRSMWSTRPSCRPSSGRPPT